jgi:glutamate-1-semialdehyde aminotransferase
VTATESQSNLETIERARRVTAAEEYDIGIRFPSVFASGQGSWMVDVEGNRLLDVTACSGSLLLGNQHPQIVAAVTNCLRQSGVVFASTLTPQRIELAERLCARYPAGEKAVFCKTGSEGTTTAVRLARAATDRDLILTSGYHGWHDWQLACPEMGFDPQTRVANFGYNETALTRLLNEFADRTAAVIVTPEPAWFDPGYFRRLSELCARHGVLFILDEVITGLRWGARGLNGTGGVPADLVVVSKGLTNGHAMSSVLGRRDLIDAYDKAGIAGTYTREVVPMVAALAVLDLIGDGTVHEHCEQMGQQLQDGMREVLAAAGVAAHVTGPPMMFDVILESDELSREIYQAAYEHGAYFDEDGTHMVTAAFGEPEVSHALAAFEKGVRRVAQSRDIEAGPLPEARLRQFAFEAFGGAMTDDPDVIAQIEETVRQVGEGLAAAGPAGAPGLKGLAP